MRWRAQTFRTAKFYFHLWMSDTGAMRGLRFCALLCACLAASTLRTVQLGVLTTQGEGDT
ncbi:hypothetical protein ADK49_06845 [Streptomyces sp. WM6349]|nr:hypothetical protein ADK49_06845 [Streptomyces sp. WM6349]KOU91529.1 hypothetical protein ADK92_30495 [Streptomyces sp. XY533]KOV46909.1 hypothetical protein ADK98_11715 [Streptomyces sp. H036]